MSEPTTRRRPGAPPTLMRFAETALGAINNLPEREREALKPLVLEFHNLARKQDEWNRRVSEAVENLPSPHASTHKGGTDNIAGTTDPLDIDFDQDADPGTATLGFAPIDHQHALSEDMESLSGLAGVTTETISGVDVAYVSDPQEHRLLARILLALDRMEKRL